MTAPDLLPCPFCGGEARKWQDPGHSAAWFIGCDGGDIDRDCFGSIHWAETEAEAITAWNTRAAPSLSAALALPEVAALVEALMDAESVLALSEKPAFADPQHHADVTLLGRRIGFGALMSSASASWRNDLLQTGYPAGGEYVAGPCHATVVKCLGKARAAIAALEGRAND